ncbi:hypothetical protein ACJJTC_002263 [Scirpophaga incertulas]
MTDPSVSNLTIPAKLPSKSPSKLDSESVVLNRKRGVIKGRLTKLQKYVESFIAQPSNLFKAEFKLRMQGASSLLSDFNEIQSKIEERSDDIDEQLDYREEFETTYYNIIAKAHEEKCGHRKEIQFGKTNVGGGDVVAYLTADRSWRRQWSRPITPY